MKNRIVAFVAGVLLGPAVVWAGLETGTYISDLVATNPLSSDLASTADDHIRLLKSTIKTTFPNINDAITVTDEQINAVGASGVTGAANPTGSVGLSAVNGSATTFMRSDGAPALSQSIAPTMTGKWIYTFSGGGSGGAINISAAQASISLNETDGAVDNRLWDISTTTEQLSLRTVNDASAAVGNIMLVDRTGTQVDRVTFPTTAGLTTPFYIGQTAVGTVGTNVAAIHTNTASNTALSLASPTAATRTLYISNMDTAGNNVFTEFYTEGLIDTIRGSISYNRAGGLVAYNTTSADNAKRNIRPAKSARRVIDCIQVVEHDWKNSTGHMDYWVTAGKLDPCAPWAVSYDTKPEVDGKVDVSKLVPAMIKYMQEQDARIAALERRLH